MQPIDLPPIQSVCAFESVGAGRIGLPPTSGAL